MYATQNGNLAIVRELFNWDANPNQVENHGNTSLMIGIITNQRMTILETLIAAGADPNVKNRRDQTAFDLAEKYNQTDVIQLLNEIGQHA